MSNPSMRGCVMSCSMARSSIRCVRPRSSSRAGDATTMRSGHMHRWAIALPPQRFLCRRLSRGRPRNFNQLRRKASVAHEPKPKLISNPDHSVGAGSLARKGPRISPALRKLRRASRPVSPTLAKLLALPILASWACGIPCDRARPARCARLCEWRRGDG